MFRQKFVVCGRTALLISSVAVAPKLYESLQRCCREHTRHNSVRSRFQFLFPTLYAASSSGRSKYMADPISDEASLYSDDIKNKMELLILRIQKAVCEALEAEETSDVKFTVDRWQRQNPNEGGGITCVMEGGEVFERAGVNITVMTAPLNPRLQESMRARGKNLPQDRKFEFFAAGISSVIHPLNPHCPTMHFNYRYFEVQDEFGQNKHSWFGGGADLTPSYLEPEDAKHFHKVLKQACDKHGVDRYPTYKKLCDNYFFNVARGERRGVGGIFFDDLEADDPITELQFVTDCAEAIVPSYVPIVKRRKNVPYTADEREWQLLRRGRYVEFNLVYDRGTKFGFATPGARIESVLVSMPATAKWKYRHSPAVGSREYKLVEVLKNPVDWV